MIRTSFVPFWIQQAIVMGPATLPVWIVGLVGLLVSGRWRILGYIFLAVAALLVASGSSRPNYLTVAYPALLAAGGVAIERFAAARGRRWLRPVTIAWLVLLGLPAVPMGLPILPVDTLIAYQRATGMRTRSQEHTSEGELSQVFADMFGWEDLTRRVARVYESLSPEERARCAIFTDNYGEAGAIDFFGPRYGLPPAISGHNNYWLWGPRGYTGEVMIVLGVHREDLERGFASVVLADSVRCEHCMPYERDLPVWICRGLRVPLREAWARVMMYV
jgi:hypothetical protein